MRHLLNTLFVNSEDIYLSLDGENVVASRGKQEMARYPLHILSGIVSFSYAGASPALMGACVQRDVSLAFCTPRGRFLARVSGESSGNVLLRRTQYRTADDPGPCCRIARNMIFGKVHTTRWSVERTRRDHGLRIDESAFSNASAQLRALLPQIAAETSLEQLRGLEGAGATIYFSVFDQMILGEKPLFAFSNRNRRPPLDPVNALLSFAYSLLTHDCASALESVGPPRANLFCPGLDGGTASLPCGPLRPDSNQQSCRAQGRLPVPGKWGGLSDGLRPQGLFDPLAGAEKS